MELAPITAHLTVRSNKGRVTAENEHGAAAIVVDSGEVAWPGRVRLDTASGTWWIGSQGPGSLSPIVDARDAQVATYHGGIFRRTKITFDDGSPTITTRSAILASYGVSFGAAGRAKAKGFLRPGKTVELRLSDALLARPDRDLAAALMTYYAEMAISVAIVVDGQD